MVRRDLLEHAEIEEVNDIYLEDSETLEGTQGMEGMLKVEQYITHFQTSNFIYICVCVYSLLNDRYLFS